MSEGDSQFRGISERKVLGEVTNTCTKIGQPLLPGKFLIGNDRIRKQTTAGNLGDPTSRKRVIGELVNINKGKQRVNWMREDPKLPATPRNPEDGCDRDSSLLHVLDPLKRGCSCLSEGEEVVATFSTSRSPSTNILDGSVVQSHSMRRDSREDEDERRGSSSADAPFPLDLCPPELPLPIQDRSLNEDPGQSNKQVGNTLNRLNQAPDVEENAAAGKSCSCYFCLKARYVWADLLYQDCRGRLSEVNKSKKGVKGFGASSSHGTSGRVGGNDNLNQLWKTLFLHTESLLTCESAKLQSRILKLKELKESSKRDVEMKTNHLK